MRGSRAGSASARTRLSSAIAVVRTFEFQNQRRYGSDSSSTCAVPPSGRIAFRMRRRAPPMRSPCSPFAWRASRR